MTNSTAAMKIAHMIAKRFAMMSFAACLKYAWALVKSNWKIAMAFLSGKVKADTFKHGTMFGTATGIVFAYKGIKGLVKSACRVSMWARF